jgi:hypothetical protein
LKVSLLGGFVVQLCQRECILVTISSTSWMIWLFPASYYLVRSQSAYLAYNGGT